MMKQEMSPFQQKIVSQIRLSPFAVNIHLLMDALSNEGLNFRQLAAVLSQYPVIVARLLALANSAWVAPLIPITTIESACARLGMSVVKSVSVATAVSSSFNASSCPEFNVGVFWTNSILMSDGAFFLAAHLPKKQRDELAKTAQTAGILHGLGLLWLAENLPRETGKALQQVSADASLSLDEALIQCAGVGYCQAGAWIGQQWKLPDVLIIAMRHHLDASYREHAWELALLIGSALKMVSALPDSMPVNNALTDLGVTIEQQAIVFKQLSGRYEKTRTLANELFA